MAKGPGFLSWNLFLHLLVLLGAHGGGCIDIDGRGITDQSFIDKKVRIEDCNRNIMPEHDDIPKGMNVLRLHSMDQDNKINGYHLNDEKRDDAHQRMLEHHMQAHPSSSHLHQMDPALIVFFLLKDLKVGKTMPIYFPKRDPSSSPHLMPREEADSIPFSLKQLPDLLQHFSFSHGSPQAQAMEDTLRECETKPIKGETKFCATSLESMIDFTRSVLGSETKIEVLSTSHLTKSSILLQNCTILEIHLKISARKMVACHTMPYPYAIFYCHSQLSENRVFKVLLAGENGDRVDAVAVCHMDTSHWGRNHVSFRVLGIEPGTLPVCHFFPDDNFVWIPSPN